MSAHPWRLALAASILVLGPAMSGYAVELNPAALIYQLPDQFKRVEIVEFSGQKATKTTVFDGKNGWLKGKGPWSSTYCSRLFPGTNSMTR